MSGWWRWLWMSVNDPAVAYSAWWTRRARDAPQPAPRCVLPGPAPARCLLPGPPATVCYPAQATRAVQRERKQAASPPPKPQPQQQHQQPSMDDDFDGADVLVEATAPAPVPAPSPATAAPAPAAAAAPPTDDALSKRKRKREKEKANKAAAATTTTTTSTSTSTTTPSSTSSPHPSKKPKPAPKPTPTTTTPDDGSIDPTIAPMPPTLLADHLLARHKHWHPSLSALELHDAHIPAAHFADTTHWQAQRSLPNLPNYLEKCCRVAGARKFRLDQAAEACGAPHTLVVTAAALRASRVASALRKYQSRDAMVAKLFAKHIKLAESVEVCRNNRIGIAVGTPARVLEVLREEVLQLAELRWIVVDASYVDKKGFGVLGVREVQEGVMALLGHDKVKQRLEAGELKILFF